MPLKINELADEAAEASAQRGYGARGDSNGVNMRAVVVEVYAQGRRLHHDPAQDIHAALGTEAGAWDIHVSLDEEAVVRLHGRGAVHGHGLGTIVPVGMWTGAIEQPQLRLPGNRFGRISGRAAHCLAMAASA